MYSLEECFESVNGCGECMCDLIGFVNCFNVFCDDCKLKFIMVI